MAWEDKEWKKMVNDFVRNPTEEKRKAMQEFIADQDFSWKQRIEDLMAVILEIGRRAND